MRGAFVIGRRDFSATVLSKTFLFFLLGPLFPLIFGGVFGGILGGTVGQRDKVEVAVIAPEAAFSPLQAARDRLAGAIDNDRVVHLVRVSPEPDLVLQRQRLLAAGAGQFRAVLSGIPDHPQLAGAIRPDGTTAGQLRLMLTSAANGNTVHPELVVTPVDAGANPTPRDQATTGQIAQTALFFFTLLLSTMLLSQLVEEKSNKIIEVVAAAVPIESLFVGKLFAMLAASVLGLIVWASAAAAVVASLKGLGALPPPATGWPTFLALVVVYFAMNYLLFGAVFLTIGAQAATVREVQTLSMPVTFGQMLIFGLAAAGVASPNSGLALTAQVFPLSSPLAMVARAAQEPDIWPHLAAIAWQLLWVALILKLGASMFRKTVLKSGPRTRWWSRRAAPRLASDGRG
jgi:ABC-2 type transport system permease protein